MDEREEGFTIYCFVVKLNFVFNIYIKNHIRTEWKDTVWFDVVTEDNQPEKKINEQRPAIKIKSKLDGTVFFLFHMNTYNRKTTKKKKVNHNPNKKTHWKRNVHNRKL